MKEQDDPAQNPIASTTERLLPLLSLFVAVASIVLVPVGLPLSKPNVDPGRILFVTKIVGIFLGGLFVTLLASYAVAQWLGRRRSGAEELWMFLTTAYLEKLDKSAINPAKGVRLTFQSDGPQRATGVLAGQTEETHAVATPRATAAGRA